MTQLNLFQAALNNETAAFLAACSARDAHDFFAAEYPAAQAVVDHHSARLVALQGTVHWRDWPRAWRTSEER